MTDSKTITDRKAGTPTADPRERRRAAKHAAIIAAAWDLAQRDGLAAISLRDLAERVDLRQPSLYAYFDSKLALYDALFADGYRQLLAIVGDQTWSDDPREALVQFVEMCIRFSTDDIVRHQMLFQRTVPGFTPSDASYQLALDFLEIGRARLAAVGVNDTSDADLVDIFTGIVAGFAHQQVANDPGGDRWQRHTRVAMDMFLAEVDRRNQPRKARR